MVQAAKVMNEEPRSTTGGPGESRTPGWLQKLLDYPKRFRQFLHDVRVETKQVTWPSRDDVKATTIVVIITVFVFGLYLFGVDLVASWTVNKVLNLFK
jgi:preprotein translocase subunit SecE